MATYNRFIAVGYVGGEPEQKTFPNGNTIVTFSVSTTERYRDRSGKDAESTDWHRCQIGANAVKKQEFVMNYVHRGDIVAVEGAVHYSEKDGRTYTNISVSDIRIVSSKEKKSTVSGTVDEVPGDMPASVAAGFDF